MGVEESAVEGVLLAVLVADVLLRDSFDPEKQRFSRSNEMKNSVISGRRRKN